MPGSKTVSKQRYTGAKSNKRNIINISVKDINDEYAYGDYAGFKVIIMKENGYINATHMCSRLPTQNEIFKDFENWLCDDNAQELINALSILVDVPTDDLLIPITTSSKKLTEIRGTYAHPKLIPHIASWASPIFAVRVADIVNRYFTKKAIKEKEKIIKKKKKNNSEKR